MYVNNFVRQQVSKDVLVCIVLLSSVDNIVCIDYNLCGKIVRSFDILYVLLFSLVLILVNYSLWWHLIFSLKFSPWVASVLGV